MKATTSFLRTLSSRLPTTSRSTSSSTVTPLPEQSRFSEEVTAKLDALRSSEYEYGSASWLVDVLDATIVTQKVAQQQVVDKTNNITLSELDKEMIESYLEDNIELLDACNGLVEKIEVIHKYVESLYIVTKLLPIEGRSQEIMFKECGKLEVQCGTLDKCSPKLCRLMGRKVTRVIQGEQDVEMHEVLSGSREVASMGCHLLQRALSFKSRQGLLKTKSKLQTTWSNSMNELQVMLNEAAEGRKKSAPWMMNELEKMVMNARIVQDQVKSCKRNNNNNNIDIDDLKRSCRALEEEVKPLEERVRELYKLLISIRMVLLGLLSKC